MKQKSVKTATLKDWLVSKAYSYYDKPIFSLRYQRYYLTFVFKAPIDFNAFRKYYHQKIKGLTVDTRICSTIAPCDLLTIDQFRFGDVKEEKGNIHITIWASKATLAKDHFSGHTGMPPRTLYSPGLPYSGYVRSHICSTS